MGAVQAPICYINPPPPTAEPVTPTIPAIPVATNLASAIQAVNILRQIIQTQGNQIPGGGTGGGGSSTHKKKNDANFVEIKAKRISTTTRVFNPQNRSQYVDVKQITSLTFIDPISKQEITWQQ